MKAIKTRFGTRPPTVEQAVEAVAHQRGEVIVSNGAAAANALGLTTQVPVRSIYLTSGRSRTMNVGSQKVELKHVPRWQLSSPAGRPASLYARSRLGPERADEALVNIRRKLPPRRSTSLLLQHRSFRPLARSVGKAAHG